MQEAAVHPGGTNNPCARAAREGEEGGWGGLVTDWRQVVILCLSPMEVVKMLGGGLCLKSTAAQIARTRQQMRAEGWEFVPAGRPNAQGRAYLRALPPQGQESDLRQAKTTWQAECAFQQRSTWGMRVRPGKAAGN